MHRCSPSSLLTLTKTLLFFDYAVLSLSLVIALKFRVGDKYSIRTSSQRWLYVSFEILVRTPVVKLLDPGSNSFSREVRTALSEIR